MSRALRKRLKLAAALASRKPEYFSHQQYVIERTLYDAHAQEAITEELTEEQIEEINKREAHRKKLREREIARIKRQQGRLGKGESVEETEIKEKPAGRKGRAVRKGRSKAVSGGRKRRTTDK